MFNRSESRNLANIQPPASHDQPNITDDLIMMLARKGLDYSVFIPSAGLSLDSDLHEHAAWAFQHIYSHDYPMGAGPRYMHGIEHVTRVATYVPVVLNLFRKYGDHEALALSDSQNVKLLQIAALFHDSARENEGVDYWDKESAVILFLYLTRVLKVNSLVAANIAAASANKDADSNNGHEKIVEDPYITKIVRHTYNPTGQSDKQKSLSAKIIHDADCLDIIRARSHFKCKYLDLYQFYLSIKNDWLLDDIAHLRCEVRSLIDLQGDSFNDKKPHNKKYYHHAKSYQRTLALIRRNKQKYRLLNTLGEALLTPAALSALFLVDRTPYDIKAGFTTSNMNAALREGRVFVRGQGSPSAIALNGRETLAELELRKTFRDPDISISGKLNHGKNGNPYRSISMLGYGGGVFNSAGFIIVDPDPSRISKVNSRDCNSGRGKKTDLRRFFQSNPRPQMQEILLALDEVTMTLKLGGEPFISQLNQAFYHTEILYDLICYHAIYFSRDPNLHNDIVGNSTHPTHHHSPLLQAIYLRKLYERYYEETKQLFIQGWGQDVGLQRFTQRFGSCGTLPVFHYSGIHNTIFKIEESAMSDANIIKMWLEMSLAFIHGNKHANSVAYLHDLSVNKLMIQSMYGKESHRWALKSESADSSYSPALRTQLHNALKTTVTCLKHSAEMNHRQKIASGKMMLIPQSELAYLYKKVDIIDLINDPALKADLTKIADDEYDSFLTYDDNYFANERSNSAITHIYARARALGEATAANHLQNIAFNIIQRESRRTRGGVTKTAAVELIHVMKFILAYDLKKTFRHSMIDPLIDYFTTFNNWFDLAMPDFGTMALGLYHLNLINKENNDEIGERLSEYLLQDADIIPFRHIDGVRQGIQQLSFLNNYHVIMELVDQQPVAQLKSQ